MGPSVVSARKSGASSPNRSGITPPSPTPGDAAADEGPESEDIGVGKKIRRRHHAKAVPIILLGKTRGRPQRRSGDEHDLAHVTFVQERLLRRDDVAQRKSRTDERPDFGALDIADEPVEQLRSGDGAAVDAQVLEVER